MREGPCAATRLYTPFGLALNSFHHPLHAIPNKTRRPARAREDQKVRSIKLHHCSSSQYNPISHSGYYVHQHKCDDMSTSQLQHCPPRREVFSPTSYGRVGGPGTFRTCKCAYRGAGRPHRICPGKPVDVALPKLALRLAHSRTGLCERESE